jgi:hypothetical protein
MPLPPWLAAPMRLFRKPPHRSFEELKEVEELLAPVAEDFDLDDALGSWRWLVPQQVRALAVTAFGDVFLVDGSGAVLFLDTAAGKCEEVAASVEELKEKLRQPELLDEWFMPGLLSELRAAGKKLPPGQCYDADHSIILGGSFTPENWSPTFWRVHFHSLGQIHEQVKDLPPGTRITGIKFTPL